jgi:hypothetical protein
MLVSQPSFSSSLLQSADPVSQAPLQTPLAQVGVVTLLEEQEFPQPPQLPGSAVRSAQLIPHSVCPAVHPHTPALHTSDGEQTFPQAPQSAVSVMRSAQVPLQFPSSLAQLDGDVMGAQTRLEELTWTVRFPNWSAASVEAWSLAHFAL